MYVYLVTQVLSDSATSWAVTCQAPLSIGFPRQEYWSELLFTSLGDLPDTGIEPMSPALAGRFSTTEPPGKPGVDLAACSNFTRLSLLWCSWENTVWDPPDAPSLGNSWGQYETGVA